MSTALWVDGCHSWSSMTTWSNSSPLARCALVSSSPCCWRRLSRAHSASHSVKYEEVYLKAYTSASEARRELGAYFRFYNNQRPHQALGYRTPAEVFHQVRNAPAKESKVTEVPPEQVLVSLAGAARLSLNSTSTLS